MTGTNTTTLDDRQEKKTNIYILPPFTERDLRNINILIQTDGNNRAKGVNQGYEHGGKNVVTIAEYLAHRGDVSKMIACIMSSDNADKRGDEFFWSMYQAFLGLGVKIELAGTLVKKGIRMEACGNMDQLKKRGDTAAQFAEMVETVCAKTHKIHDPKLRLLLGINYDPNIALEQQADCIYRSGMEDENAVRLSGMRTHKGIHNIGSKTLWPEVTTDEIGSVIDSIKQATQPTLKLGYEAKVIVAIMGKLHGSKYKANITIPYTGSTGELESVIKYYHEQNGGKPHHIQIQNAEGVVATTYGQAAATHSTIELIHSSLIVNKISKEYHAFIAPGQQDAFGIQIPEQPEAKYATIHQCPRGVEGIVDGINKAARFAMENVKLKGAERKIPTAKIYTPATSNPQPTAEFANFSIKGKTLADIQRELANESEQNTPEGYQRAVDIFTEYMMAWGRKKEFPIENEAQHLAYINYAITSLFMTYFPQHPTWKRYEKDGLERAFGLTRYMELVYMTDEYIYDLVLPDERVKRELMSVATEVLAAAVEGKSVDPAIIPPIANRDMVIKLAEEYRVMAEDLKSTSDQPMFEAWVKAMKNLFKSFAEEWSEKSVKANTNKDPSTSVDEDSVTGSGSETERDHERKILQKAPPYLREKMEQAIQQRDSGGSDEKIKGQNALRLHEYFLDIEDSIGAGIAFRTLACMKGNEAIDEKTVELYEELCFLLNIFYRIANDMSGALSRGFNDQENKTDCCSIVQEKYLALGHEKGGALIKSIAELKLVPGEKRHIFVSPCVQRAAQNPRPATACLSSRSIAYKLSVSLRTDPLSAPLPIFFPARGGMVTNRNRESDIVP